MTKNKDKKNKKQIDTRKLEIILDIILILVGFVFLYFGIRDLMVKIDSTKVTDAEKFSRKYSYVSKDESIYKYISYKDAEIYLKSNGAIILVGNPLDSWTQVLVKPLNDLYKTKGKEIYYLELNDEDIGTRSYISLIKALNVKSLNTPTIIKVDKTKFKVYTKKDIYDSSYDGAPIDYFTKENIEKLKKLIDED